MTTVTTSNARHLLFNLNTGEQLPTALLNVLRDEVVVAGWMRGSGVLSSVKLRVLDGTTRALAGSVHVVSLEGSVGLAKGDVSTGLRVVVARETDAGHQLVAGEIVEARVETLELHVIALDDVTASREAAAGVTVLKATGATAAKVAPAPAPVAAPAAPPPPAPAPAPVASEPAAPAAPPPAPSSPSVPAPAKPSPTFMSAAMPPKPVKPATITSDEEQAYPDAGDVVEHFAFGRCEVVKSDGDRLHLRLGKDGRIKEIALEMLRVTPLPPVEGSTGKHYKLDRKL